MKKANEERKEEWSESRKLVQKGRKRRRQGWNEEERKEARKVGGKG